MSSQPKFLRVIYPAPILNTPDFSSVFGGKDGKTLKKDEKGHVRSFEFVALRNTLLQIQQTYKYPQHCIHKVTASFYRSPKLYIDSRFTAPYEGSLDPEPMPSAKTIIANLEKSLGASYVWGGNYREGIVQLLEFYPPKAQLDIKTKNTWMLKGVDCSGLIYEAANGFTPRNTGELSFFGKTVPVKNKSPKEILLIIKPLDLIIFPGHVIIVLSSCRCIESREQLGVIKTPTYKLLKELCQIKKPINDPKRLIKESFVIRRWL